MLSNHFRSRYHMNMNFQSSTSEVTAVFATIKKTFQTHWQGCCSFEKKNSIHLPDMNFASSDFKLAQMTLRQSHDTLSCHKQSL